MWNLYFGKPQLFRNRSHEVLKFLESQKFKLLFKNSKVIFEEIVNKRNLKEAINIRGE